MSITGSLSTVLTFGALYLRVAAMLKPKRLPGRKVK